MQPDLLEGLVSHRKELLAHKQELEDELDHLNAIIEKYQSGATKPALKIIPRLKQPRVRGVLAAARRAIDEFAGPFDKNELLAKLIEIDKEFAHKKITGSNIRNALRLLTQDGVIRIESEATATTCAKYIKAA